MTRTTISLLAFLCSCTVFKIESSNYDTGEQASTTTSSTTGITSTGTTTTGTTTTGTTTGTSTTGTSTTGTATTTGNPSACISAAFDGYQDYAILDAPTSYGASHTIEFWLKATDAHGWDMVIGHGLNNGGTFSINNDSGTEDCFPMKWDNGSRIDSVSCVDRDQWHHIAGVQDGSNARLYLDGALVGTGSGDGTGPIGPMVLGDEQADCCDGGPHAYEGLLSQVRVSSNARYDGDFTPDSTLENDGDTILFLQLDEGSGSTVYDSAGSNHGTMMYDATWVDDCP